jgi:hypothetical protein
MCCIQVVPLFGYEHIKMSDTVVGSLRHLSIVADDDIDSKGMSGRLLIVNMIFKCA